MVGNATLVGLEDILSKMEQELGEPKVKRVINKSLREVGKEIEPEFKARIAGYRDTGETAESVTLSGVLNGEGIPKIMLGFGPGSRWRLVHLSEFGYAKKSNPRGLGVIRRFAAELEGVYPEKISSKLKGGFGL